MRILSQIICIAGRECKWLFISGSPCQDLTIAGPTQGIVGICGRQSSLLFYVHLAIWYIQMKYPAGYVRFLAENVGSMQDFHKIAIKEILGLEQVNDDALKWDTSVHFGIRRERFFFRNYDDCGHIAIQEYSVLGEDGFGPLRNTNNQPIALGPLLRVREDLGNNKLRLSWTAYQPISLLWDYSYWEGTRNFLLWPTSSKMPDSLRLILRYAFLLCGLLTGRNFLATCIGKELEIMNGTTWS